jgi:hypothetical protein
MSGREKGSMDGGYNKEGRRKENEVDEIRSGKVVNRRLCPEQTSCSEENGGVGKRYKAKGYVWVKEHVTTGPKYFSFSRYSATLYGANNEKKSKESTVRIWMNLITTGVAKNETVTTDDICHGNRYRPNQWRRSE